MADLANEFVGGVFDKLGRFAPWTPNVPVALGDVGVLEGGVFVQKTTLGALGISFEPQEKSKGAVVDFSSQSGVSVTMKAKGTALPKSAIADANAGAVVEFTAEGGAILQASGVRVIALKDALNVGNQVLANFKKDLWEQEWLFVDEVQLASKTTVLISEAKAARLELEAKGDIAGEVPLAAGLTIAKKQGSVLMLLGKDGLTPLFKLSRVKKHVLASLLSGEKQGTIADGRRAFSLAKPGDEILEDVQPPGRAGGPNTQPRRGPTRGDRNG